MMRRRFRDDERGNFGMLMGIAIIPLVGFLALAVDYSEISRERQLMLNAMDMAGIATARRIVEGATDTQARDYAVKFFHANMGNAIGKSTVDLTVTLPSNSSGGGFLSFRSCLNYSGYFLPAAERLLGMQSPDAFCEDTQYKLKNTMEVSLVLDNSGSMNEQGGGSSKVRFDLLKSAAKQLVDSLADQAQNMKQVAKPVQFSVVPFAASVNVGNQYATANWMDTDGISPVHHENFDWTTMPSRSASPNKYVEKVGAAWYARGKDWGAQQDRPLTRFSLFNLMQRVTGKSGGKTTYGAVASWGGCTEARPYPYNIQDTPASASNAATLFVPMFAPDETNNVDGNSRPANNNWLSDIVTSGTDVARQKYMPKYFDTGAASRSFPMGEGPNMSCTTQPITPLTEVSSSSGRSSVKASIDAMTAGGATNVVEGMAWGWRTLSSGAPFTEGRPESERGNDKVVIVLTDGANTYYTPSSVVAQSYSGSGYARGGNDLAGSRAVYAAYGYLKPYNSGYTYGRLFQGQAANFGVSDFSNTNYSKAMNAHFATLCNNAKNERLIVMTVALDLDSRDTTEKAQIQSLTSCASDSRFRKNGDGSPVKLFWNTTGGDLSKTFKEIADELSNLRIVG